MPRHRERSSTPRSVALSLAAAAVAPIAWVAGQVLAPPILPAPIAAPRRSFASRAAGRVSLYESHARHGVPLVLFHDVAPAACARELRELFEAFRSERPSVAVELPGWGRTADPAPSTSREAYVATVCEVLEDVARRHATAPDVVAVGRASEIVAAAAQRAWRRVRSLTLIAPTGFAPGSLLRDCADRAMKLAVRMPRARRIAHRVLTSRPALRALVGRRSPCALEIVDQAANAAKQPRAAERMDAICGALAPDAAVALYTSVPLPVLFVHGDVDAREMDAIDRLVARRSGARRARIACPPRMVHVEHAAEAAEAMRSFFRSLTPRPPLRLIRGGGAPLGVRRLRRPSLHPAHRTGGGTGR
jgi:pimeloyl-ACP methyl ester carboxylesterase